MNTTEQKIYEDIIERYEYRKRMNNSWRKQAKSDFDILALERAWLICEEIPLLSYLDGRRNLVDIPNYCSDTWEKIDIKRIKENLNIYLKKNEIQEDEKIMQEWYDLYIETDGKPWINLYYYWREKTVDFLH